MPVKVQLPRIPKPKLLRSNPLRKSLILGGEDPYNTVDDEDLYIGYRRVETPRFRQIDDDEDLPEHITKKLEKIRVQALAKYKEIWG